MKFKLECKDETFMPYDIEDITKNTKYILWYLSFIRLMGEIYILWKRGDHKVAPLCVLRIADVTQLSRVYDIRLRVWCYMLQKVWVGIPKMEAYFHAEKYILTLLCLITHAHTHTYISNINLVCQVILKSSEGDILYDFHLNVCIIYFISCDSGELLVIRFNAFCLTSDSSYETMYHFDCRTYAFHSACSRVDIRLSCWYCSV